MTAATALPPNTACPRCGGDFRCGVSDGHCACFGLTLTPALQQALAARYPEQCLCLDCLAALSGAAAASEAALRRALGGD
ncbi:cysteine-rich CWC family protein [Roseateles amylovorans]|jgi:Cysteine-rich CWC|uniref:Cysteine-rich CWC family protein n=1 Tax=Roseateles amylovorans TaxID=2978473 RepID=A0ABY6AX84_9BURK|nr:cysteine-rich CWC family protein [Roseateles amylovorans]UXH77786.1 cysteine-rich CWC family protein [Roseateles amylovorans]